MSVSSALSDISHYFPLPPYRLLLISLPRRDRGLSVDGVPRGRFRSAPVIAEHCTGAPHERLSNQSMTKVVGSSSRSGGTSLPGILAGCLRPRGEDTSTVAFPKNVCETASSIIENKNLYSSKWIADIWKRKATKKLITTKKTALLNSPKRISRRSCAPDLARGLTAGVLGSWIGFQK